MKTLLQLSNFHTLLFCLRCKSIRYAVTKIAIFRCMAILWVEWTTTTKKNLVCLDWVISVYFCEGWNQEDIFFDVLNILEEIINKDLQIKIVLNVSVNTCKKGFLSVTKNIKYLIILGGIPFFEAMREMKKSGEEMAKVFILCLGKDCFWLISVNKLLEHLRLIKD